MKGKIGPILFKDKSLKSFWGMVMSLWMSVAVGFRLEYQSSEVAVAELS